jgi:signal transduction histidine kinase
MRFALSLRKRLLILTAVAIVATGAVVLFFGLAPSAGSAFQRDCKTGKFGAQVDLSLVKAARGAIEVGRSEQSKGPGVVVASGHALEGPGGVFAMENSGEAPAQIFGLRNVLILVVILLFLGGVAVAYLIAWSVTRPLERRTRELQQANEKLKILDELKSEFVSMASHELRSPLSSMKMGVSTVLNEMVGPLNDEQKMMLAIAERNIERLTNLTTDLLDLTKIEAGQLDLMLADNDLQELAGEVVRADQPAAEEKGVSLELVSPGGNVVARCDWDRMYQVLQNLVSNALRFTDEGKVTVSVGLDGDYLKASVADTGVGIAPGAINTVFEKWSQAHSETDSDKRGTGLGLAICKGIVEAHRGSITVKSEPEEGTTFSFLIPVRGPDEEREQDTDSR